MYICVYIYAYIYTSINVYIGFKVGVYSDGGDGGGGGDVGGLGGEAAAREPQERRHLYILLVSKRRTSWRICVEVGFRQMSMRAPGGTPPASLLSNQLLHKCANLSLIRRAS